MAKKAASAVPVSERALAARLSRALEKEGSILRRCRSDSRWHNELGSYYVVDAQTNSVTDKHVDLETRAREAGVMKEFERLAE